MVCTACQVFVFLAKFGRRRSPIYSDSQLFHYIFPVRQLFLQQTQEIHQKFWNKSDTTVCSSEIDHSCWWKTLKSTTKKYVWIRSKRGGFAGLIVLHDYADYAVRVRAPWRTSRNLCISKKWDSSAIQMSRGLTNDDFNTFQLKTSQELRMLSRSLSDCKSLLLNVMIQVSQFVSNSQLCH